VLTKTLWSSWLLCGPRTFKEIGYTMNMGHNYTQLHHSDVWITLPPALPSSASWVVASSWQLDTSAPWWKGCVSRYWSPASSKIVIAEHNDAHWTHIWGRVKASWVAAHHRAFTYPVLAETEKDPCRSYDTTTTGWRNVEGVMITDKYLGSFTRSEATSFLIHILLTDKPSYRLVGECQACAKHQHPCIRDQKQQAE
jgi:hypothetical protein